MFIRSSFAHADQSFTHIEGSWLRNDISGDGERPRPKRDNIDKQDTDVDDRDTEEPHPQLEPDDGGVAVMLHGSFTVFKRSVELMADMSWCFARCFAGC